MERPRPLIAELEELSVDLRGRRQELAEIDEKIKALEEKLDATGDDAQLADVDLQQVLREQQATLQLLSTISKGLHDTAMSIIRKIGG